MKEQAEMRGLLAVFPTFKSLKKFRQHDQEIAEKAIPKFIQYAYRNNFIEKETPEAFEDFIKKQTQPEKYSSLQDLSFEEFLKKVRGDLSINNLIEHLNEIAEQFNMIDKKIQASMISRMKQDFSLKTTKQRTMLRILAFWVAYENPEYYWNFEKFSKIAESQGKTETEGIVIAFGIQGKRGVITSESMGWLEEELSSSINYLKLFNPIDSPVGTVSSLHLTLPIKPGNKDFPKLYPALYNSAIRDSLAIAHQMSVRWLIKYGSEDEQLMVIAIYAGDLKDANVFLSLILEKRFTGSTQVLLNNFAYKCAQAANLKVVFKQPETFDFGREYLLKIRFVDYFWMHPYYDFIPELLDDFSKADSKKYENRLQKYQHNPLLLMEIAKVLMARQELALADKVLTDILVLNPHHVLARITRMFIYRNIASETDGKTCELIFERALEEKKLISFDSEDSELLCEIGTIYYAFASVYFKFLDTEIFPNEKKIFSQKIVSKLKQARKHFLKATSLAPDGKDIRSFALWIRTETLLECFKNYKFIDEFRKDSHDVYYEVAIRFFKLLRVLPADFPEMISHETMKDKKYRDAYRQFIYDIFKMNGRYQDSVMFSSFTPNTLYFFGCLLWDYLPVLSKKLCCLICSLFAEARRNAEKLKNDDLTIYVPTSIYPNEPDKFIKLIDKSISLIMTTEVVTEEELLKGSEFSKKVLLYREYELWKDDNEFMQDRLSPGDMKKVSGNKLFMLSHTQL